MSGPSCCKHGHPDVQPGWEGVGPCPECEREGREFRERVQRGEEPCPICGDTVRELRKQQADWSSRLRAAVLAGTLGLNSDAAIRALARDMHEAIEDGE